MAKQKEFMDKLKAAIPDISGSIETKRLTGTVLVAGSVSTSDTDARAKIEKAVSEIYPNELFIYSVEINTGFTVIEQGEVESTVNDSHLDELKIVYMGNLPINAITANPKFKFINKENFVKVDDCIKVLDFIAPIILDSKLTIIDGNLRYEMAKENKKLKVPVVILNAADKRTDFLRMVLNRSSEFQRWVYSDIDNFVDTNPQVQPLAEPLGFFGKLLLPTSFFANTVVNYRIDEYNEQQKMYRQEMGIAQWAELMRERNAKIEAAKEIRGKKKKQAVSLFDLAPKPSDFIQTHDIKEDLAEHVAEMRKVAQEVTSNYDAERKEKLVASGKWQGTRRTSTEKANDARIEATRKQDEESSNPNAGMPQEVVIPSVKEKAEPVIKEKKKKKKQEKITDEKPSLADLIAQQKENQSRALADFAGVAEPTKKEVILDDLF